MNDSFVEENNVYIELYHITNSPYYKEILKKQKILPYSNPYWKAKLNQGEIKEHLEKLGADFNKLKQIIKTNNYIVGFDKPIPNEWIKTGLMTYLLNHLKKSKIFGKENCTYPFYSFKLKVKSYHLFVRDHYYLSPEYFMKKYNKDYFKILTQEGVRKSILRYPEIAQAFVLYLNSTQNYFNYLKNKNQYKVPELWYAGEYILEQFEGVKEITEKGIKILSK